MNVVRFSITKPVTVIVAVVLVVLFGLMGLQRLPYQLSPTVLEPDITVTTTWRGATPYEMERDIIEEQEKVLKGIPGLVEMESDSQNGRGRITLRFAIGTDVDDALLRVSNKLNEVRSYPEGADRPVINATGAATSPVIWMIMRTAEGNDREVDTYLSFFEDEIRQHLERVEGVADLFVPGGRLTEMHVVVRPQRLAAYGLTVNGLIESLRAENVNISAGTMGVGRRNYRIRTTAEYKSKEDIENLVLRSTGQRRLLLKEVAEVRPGFAKRDSTVLHNGERGMAIGIKPEAGTNILEMTERVEAVVRWLNEEKMRPNGVFFDWVYDQRFYINGAINLIKKNIAIGGFFAITVLLVFLRSVRSTIVVATAIPISVIGTFIFMDALGRNLNVVSLSGIAFAVGMLVDNSIVVIENIDRHRGMGKSAFDAAFDGTREVWGAVLASTLTTIAVFLPVVFLKEEAGQLFKDIAIAVVSAVSLSLMVSVAVIPMLSSRMLAGTKKGVASLDVLAGVGRRVSGFMISLVGRAIHSWQSRLVTVISLTAIAVVTTYALFPKMEYLPQGNRNLVISLLVPPPGLSNEERLEIGQNLFRYVKPYMKKDHGGYPGIKHMFYVGADRIMLFGALSTHWDRAGELVPLFKKFIFSQPGMYGVSYQAGIFQTRLGRGRNVEVDISGSSMDDLVRSAGMMFGRIKGIMPDAQVRPVPSIELLYPEVRIVPDRDRLKANGLTARELGVAIDVLMDGRDIGDFKQEGSKKRDLVLMTSEEYIDTPEKLYGSPVVTPKGDIVPLSSLASMERTTGITQIRHLERNRTITLQVTPPKTVPLQAAIETIQSDVIAPMREGGMLRGVDVDMSGAADKLSVTRRALQWNFILAAVIAYLLMAALFGNFIYPLAIMFTVPLAGAGGIVGLRLVNLLSATPTPMDIVTMLGFIILVGIVVNNAILIVYQSLNYVRHHGMHHRDAVLEATKVRLRPIYMSASTSIFGMMPLVLFPGAGSELYRGLGSVILGGLAVSTIFTVFVVPSLLMFVIRMEKPAKAEAED